MYLKSMELTGFKSFAEGKIEFPKGVTAIVGPNGVGKSNIMDAILWVLGEQSAKTLRGERMEDVIFNGTESRKPLGMAEVSLVLSGASIQHLEAMQRGTLQVGDFHEIMVTRRLYQNGESEYLINKTLCRLKDIRSLLLDTRAGTKGHIVIEPGRIEQILNASPRDRRELIEETAGIVRYKKQRAEAFRKLESTQQNLLRVRDIVSEVRRQLTALERQARQARIYQTLQQEARALEIRLLVREFLALRANQVKVDEDWMVMETKESGLVTDEARLTSEHEALRLQMMAGEEAVVRLRDSLGQVEHQQSQALTAVEVEQGRLELYGQQRAQAEESLARLDREREETAHALADLRARLAAGESDIAVQTHELTGRERAAQDLAARRMEALGREEQARRRILDMVVEAANAESTVAGLEGQRVELARRGERLAEEFSALEQQRTSVLERLQSLVETKGEQDRRLRELGREQGITVQALQQREADLERMDDTLARQQEELAALESRLQALQRIVREEMGDGRGGEEATSLQAACRGVRAAIAEWLVVPPGVERAIEAALGERVRAWLVDGPTEAREAMTFLKEKGLGRGAFVPVRPRWAPQAAGSPPWWPALQGQPGVRGLAVDLVQGTGVPGGTDAQALTCLFYGMVIVETFEDALALWNQNLWVAPEGPTLVTLDGEILDVSGVVTGGESSASGGPLLRRREIQALETARAELYQRVEQGRQARAQLVRDSQSSKSTLQQLDSVIRDMEMQMLACSKDEASVRERLEGLGERLQAVRSEQKALEAERVRVEAALEGERTRKHRLAEEKNACEADHAGFIQMVRVLQEEDAALQQRITDARLTVTSLLARHEHDKADLARLLKEQEDRHACAGKLHQDLEAVLEAARSSQAERDRSQARFHDLDRQAGELRAELASAKEALARDMETLHQLERKLASVRESLTSARKARTEVEVRRAEIKTHLAALESTLRDTYALSVETALACDTGSPGEADNGARGTDQEGGGPPFLKEELQKIRDQLQRMGPINLASIEEHQSLEERYRFLVAQEEDLSSSIRSLKQIIARINHTTKQMLLNTFSELQQKFGEVFAKFFPGGRAELIMVESQERGESGEESGEELGVEVVAQPPGKRLKSITMLSGGEKTLAAMALIFASFLIRPTPFCIVDEIDAPLDEENIGRFTTVLRELAEGTQFLVVTHSRCTMAVADSLFGVTMEEPGVSKLVSVRMADLQPA